jgi:hypothetical protein
MDNLPPTPPSFLPPINNLQKPPSSRNTETTKINNKLFLPKISNRNDEDSLVSGLQNLSLKKRLLTPNPNDFHKRQKITQTPINGGKHRGKYTKKRRHLKTNKRRRYKSNKKTKYN